METLVFLLLAASISTMANAAAHRRSPGQIFEVAEVVLDDGTVVQDSKVIDANCEYETDTAIFPDRSTSTVYNDYPDGQGLVLSSKDTSVCYVRDISDEETQRAKTCNQGKMRRQTDGPSEVRKLFVKGEELSIDDLPDALKGQCVGRQIIKLVEQQAKGTAGSLSRDKRACCTVVAYVQRYVCDWSGCGWVAVAVTQDQCPCQQ